MTVEEIPISSSVRVATGVALYLAVTLYQHDVGST